MAESRETEHKGFEQPDDTREFPNSRVEILKIARRTGRFATLVRMRVSLGFSW